MTEASCQRPCVAGVHVREMLRTGSCPETESRFMAAKDWGVGGCSDCWWVQCFSGGEENVLL